MAKRHTFARISFDEDGKPISMTEVQPSAFDRIRVEFESTEAEWRMCQLFVAKTLPSIDDLGMWKNALLKMAAAVEDWIFLRLVTLLEEALTLAIDTHAPTHLALPTLNDKLRFAEDLKLLKQVRELHLLKKARNEFMHMCLMNAEMEADHALNVIAAELDHLGFGPIVRITPEQWLEEM